MALWGDGEPMALTIFIRESWPTSNRAPRLRFVCVCVAGWLVPGLRGPGPPR